MALLRSAEVIPACSSDHKRRYDFRVASDLKKAPLLSVSTRVQAWDRWFSAHNAPIGAAQTNKEFLRREADAKAPLE